MSDNLDLWYSNIFFWRKWSFKTQQAVIDAYNAYNNWSIIISNIWLNFPHIRFHGAKSLCPILLEIAEYCNDHVMAIEAPLPMLHEYGMKRKTWTVKKYFLLFDEIGNHLNNRTWQTNFKDPILRDMLTEPRKYKLTIVGICQSYEDVDIAFLRSCEDWFLFSRTWQWWFHRVNCTHFWVMNGRLDFDELYVLEKRRKFAFWWKLLTLYRSLYWTGEIVWTGIKSKIPHQFNKGDIYAPKIPDLPHTSKASEKWTEWNEENMGDAGAPPATQFTTKIIENVSVLKKESRKKAKKEEKIVI